MAFPAHGPFGGNLCATWDPLWALLAVLGPVEAVLGPLGDVLGPSWAVSGPIEAPPGSFFGRLGGLLGGPKTSLSGDLLWTLKKPRFL